MLATPPPFKLCVLSHMGREYELSHLGQEQVAWEENMRASCLGREQVAWDESKALGKRANSLGHVTRDERPFRPRY